MKNTDKQTAAIYAHTLDGCTDPKQWQTLKDHLEQTAKQAEKFAEPFGSSDWAWNAGLLHDLGKIDGRFQKKLRVANGIEYENETLPGNVNHSGAGAAYAETLKPFHVGRTLAYLVAGHHAGLPDLQRVHTGTAAWEIRKSDAEKDLKLIADQIEPYLSSLKTLEKCPSFVNKKNYHLWVRMLFSCLVDADWLDTERFMDPKRYENRPTFPPMEQLAEKFREYMKRFDDCTKTRVNELRREILDHCRSAALLEEGLFSLTVPTGGGKTLSGMAFALDHAVRFGKERIIYVIPYTSIIEQTAKTLRKIFGDENVVEHHSNIVYEETDPKKREQQTAHDLAAENWDAPIIVTTNVQFFESLYSAKPKRCRKLHNITNSVVLLDEAQLIPPEYLAPCVDVIRNLTQAPKEPGTKRSAVPGYGVSLVLCTATQPSPEGLKHAREIIPEPQKYYNELKRTNIHFPEDVNKPSTWDEIAERLKQHEQVLCVVNTRMDCRTVYDLMPKGTIHLSALMCGEHRSDVIAEIRERLERKETLRVISTQLVEAGVDFDFPVVYRALAGLDSIVQAAGRCNREGKLKNDENELIHGDVHVFVPPKPAPKGMLRKGEDTTKVIMERHRETGDLKESLFQPEIFKEYFASLYSKNDKMKENAEKFKAWLSDGVEIDDEDDDDPEISVYFRKAGEEFRLIEDDDSVSVVVRYKKMQVEGEEKDQRIDRYIAELRSDGPNQKLLRKLQRFTVSIPRRLFLQVQRNLFEDIAGVWVQQSALAKYTAIGLEFEINDSCFTDH